MQRQFAILAFGTLLLANSAAAQDEDALSRWGEKTGDALVRFLPKAARWGLSVDPSPLFSAFANETYDYKGANSLVRKYPSYVVHQTWWFDDGELSRQLADLNKEKEASKQDTEKAMDEFSRLHGAEMKALEKAHLAEMETLAQQGADLAKQGKYDQAQAVMQKITPFQYAPLDSLTKAIDKRQQDIADRERELANRRRQVNFRIYTNRTPTTTAPKFAPKPAGALVGHPFYRQVEGNTNMGSRVESFVDLAVFVGPPGYENPKVKIGHKELAVKCIVVWVWIESRPDTIRADEATVRKVLESMDYDGLAKLIEP
jgi:hypothetical protein